MAEKKQHLWIDRQYTRITTSLPCNITGPAIQPAPVEMLNLSAGGMKFSCSRSVFTNLLPENQRTPGLVLDVFVEIEFQLPLSGEETHSIHTSATVIHTERLAQDCYHVGVQFVQPADRDVRVIEEYISQRPPTRP